MLRRGIDPTAADDTVPADTTVAIGAIHPTDDAAASEAAASAKPPQTMPRG